MTLSVVTLQVGPMGNNTYLVGDEASQQAVIIDPSFDSEVVLEEAQRRGWAIVAIWLTHAHFDHIAGVAALANAFEPELPVGLHAADLPLYQEAGGGRMFGMQIRPGPEPQIFFEDGQQVWVGEQALEVRHTLGHTAGHVVFYAPEAGLVLCGDLIFYHSVGRTDLPGSSQEALLKSIQAKIFPLPDETRLLSGHGPETTVGEEKAENPFL